MMYFMFIVCLLHSLCIANSFFQQKTFFGRRVLSMKLRKNENKDLFDKFEKYSLENNIEKKDEVLFDIYKSLKFKRQNETVNNENVNYHNVTILPVDFTKMVDDIDSEYITNNLKGNIPRAPQSEEEIIEESFEGYLRSEFYKIVEEKGKINGKNIIYFESFYEWKKKKGIVFEKHEIREMFAHVIGTKYICDLMEFIKLNHFIDEQNAGHF